MSVKQDVARANPNTLADFFRTINLGGLMRGQVPQMLSRRASSADAGVLATLQSFQLPSDAKAASIIRATGRVGSVTGEYAPQTFGTTPTTGQIAVAPNGDIVVLATDAPTDMDIVYLPERGDIVTLTGVPVVTGVATIPSALTARGVVLLADANATAGAVTGRKIILVPAAGLPATTKAQLNVAKTTVSFNNATDAVTQCTLTLVVRPAAAQDLDKVLESASLFD